jgi:hypothetical protein
MTKTLGADAKLQRDVAVSRFSRHELWGWSVAFGLLTILIHLPFVFRYDLFMGSDSVKCLLENKRMLVGELKVFDWDADYTGVGPVDLLTVLVIKLLGFSIPLAGLVSLIFWGAGVSMLVACTALVLGKRAAIVGGCALAIGVPYFDKYNTMSIASLYNTTTFFVGLFLLATIVLVRRGPRSWWSIPTAFYMGWHWYYHKGVLIVWLAIATALVALPQGRDFLNRFLRSKMALLSLVAFLIGYSPELAYKAGCIGNRAGVKSLAGSFFNIASPDLMARNWYMLFRCIPTYFDADPWSRSPNSVHYLNHMEEWESFPRSAVDTIGLLAAFSVISYMIKTAVQAYRERNFEVFLLAICPFVNALVVVIAAQSGGGYYSIRRYILPAGILAVLWLGIQLSQEWQARRWIISGLLAFLLAVSLFHQWQMLQIPDELADYRKTVQDIEQHGYKYGLSWYSFSHLLTALSDERVVFGTLDYNFNSPYQKPVLEQDTVVLVWPAARPPPFEFAQKLFFGSVQIPGESGRVMPETFTAFGGSYRRIGEPKIIGELGWAPYRKVG